MRLIDGDVLIAQMEADAEQMEDSIAKMFAYAAVNDVKHAPTIEERKKGEWELQTDRHKKLYGWYICSECGAWIGNPANFCSECGALMRGTP